MIRTVQSRDLKVGMYILLDMSWWQHSFPKSHFKLTSRKQIQRIIATGIKKVKVDTSKSDAFEESAASASSVDANGDQAHQSGKEKEISKDSRGSNGTESVVTHSVGEEQPEPDTVIPQKADEESGIDLMKTEAEDDWEYGSIDTVSPEAKKKYEGSGIDTIKIEGGDDWEDGGIDTVSLGEKKEFVDSGIDTVSLGNEKEFVDSGIDTVSMGEKKKFIDSGIDTVSMGEKKEFVDSGIDSMKTEGEDEWEDGGIDTVTLGEKKEYVDSGIDSMKTEGEDEWEDGGIDTVTLDAGQSDPDTIQTPELVPVEILAAELREKLHQAHIPSQARARAMHEHCLQMMENLFTKPSATNLAQGKEMVREIVDQIMAENVVAKLMMLILSHDEHTYIHSTTVGVLSILLAKAVLKDSNDYDLVELGAGFYLHDLGRIQIPTQILNKPTKLSADDWELIRMHPTTGEKILSATSAWTEDCSHILLQHHEREDGTGYPQGLSGSDIDLPAQICRIADVYDALTSHRLYNAAPVMHHFRALKTMKASMVNHYNADIFRVFVSLFGQ